MLSEEKSESLPRLTEWIHKHNNTYISYTLSTDEEKEALIDFKQKSGLEQKKKSNSIY